MNPDWQHVRSMHAAFQQAATEHLRQLEQEHLRASRRVKALRQSNPALPSPQKYGEIVAGAVVDAMDCVERLSSIRAATEQAEAAMRLPLATLAEKYIRKGNAVLKRCGVKGK